LNKLPAAIPVYNQKGKINTAGLLSIAQGCGVWLLVILI
jgi:hypothetical protein